MPLMKALGASGATTIILGLVAFVFFSGCAGANLSSSKARGANIQNLKTFYIIKNETDNREVNVYKVIETELKSRGREAETGPRSSIPANVDVIVTYHQHWVWDFGWYLLDLLIQFRNPETNVLLASALLYQPSLQREAPELMAREVLDSMFK